ncbi:MAG: penicillin-binding protein activator [Gammaproteobacteria bacterium]|nr:penicillin-binding protein activator [Gammaproteobacteria bacterium]NNF62464.1 penicillin-binding protein activator [Gammaproteobacteria bacterium]NNM21816.1 penicillin-binding protein activator [Gammaproteobacteria bacterium]
MTAEQTILPRSRRALQALVCLATLIIAACETPGLRDDPTALENRARQQTEAGNYRSAAQIYERLAARVVPERRDQVLLSAAEAWYLAGERNRAMHNMRSVRPPLPQELSLALQVMAAALLVERGTPQQALARLRTLPADSPRIISADALAVGARAWFALERPDRAITALVEREVWLNSESEILANQQMIWQGLRSAGESTIPATADPVLAGWLELGNAVVGTVGDPFAERAALLRWSEVWPSHPAQGALLPNLLGQTDEFRIPQRVALLLPQTGTLESAGAAIRDGFIGAYFEYGDSVAGAEIVVYDTAALGAGQAYRLAVEEGAEFIVGPLVKSEVAEVAQLAAAGPPTLALNYLPDAEPAPRNFYQFALAPEHEARRVAQRAGAEGLQRAVALLPEGDWGERILEAFKAELEQLGGQVLAYEFYQSEATDFSSVIQPVLHLDRSHARRRAIAAEVGQRLEFEPRRRRDVDFIFIAAQPQQARLIRPQLRFHYATNLPVYATAAAFSPDPDLNRDVNGLIFAATPWEIKPDSRTQQMQTAIDQHWPRRAQHGALYAMGYDAWRLVPLLSAKRDEPLNLRGLTGELTLTANGRIERFPVLAQIEQGLAVPLDRLAVEESEDEQSSGNVPDDSNSSL